MNTDTHDRVDRIRSFDWTASDGPSRAVVSTVAEVTNTDVADLTVLYDTVDPDKLDAVLDHMDDGRVEFDYHGFRVSLEATGNGTVHETDASR